MRYITTLLMCVGLINYAQSYTLSGTLKAADTQETLLGVTIYAEGTSLGTVSNNYAVYSLTLPLESIKSSIKILDLKPNALKST